MNLKRIANWITENSSRTWFDYGLLFFITLLAAVLRFYKLGEWSFWIDEIFTINHAMFHFSTPELILQNTPPARNWVPVSVILTAQAINLWGVNELNARLVSAAIGIITIPILYFPFRKMFDTRVALIAALLLAVSPWHIEWSQNARFYTALLLFYTLALIIFFYGIERDRPLYIFIFMFLLYLATSERLFAVVILPVVLVYLLCLKILPLEKPPGLRTRNLVLILLPIVVAAIIESLSIFEDGSSRFFGDFDWFFLYTIGDPLRLLSFIGFEIGVPLMSFSFFSGVYFLAKKSRAELLIFISAVFPVILLLVINPFLFTKTRYIFVTLPSWIILGALGIREVFNAFKNQGKILALGLLFVFFADAAGSNLLYYQVNNGNRLDWKRAFTLAEERSQAGDKLVTWWPQWEGYYWDKEIILWEDLDPEFIVDSDRRFWFVLDNEIVWGNIKMKYWTEQNAELIDVLYLRREDDAYLRVYLYDPSFRTHTDTTSEEGLQE